MGHVQALLLQALLLQAKQVPRPGVEGVCVVRGEAAAGQGPWSLTCQGPKVCRSIPRGILLFKELLQAKAARRA